MVISWIFFSIFLVNISFCSNNSNVIELYDTSFDYLSTNSTWELCNNGGCGDIEDLPSYTTIERYPEQGFVKFGFVSTLGYIKRQYLGEIINSFHVEFDFDVSELNLPSSSGSQYWDHLPKSFQILKVVNEEWNKIITFHISRNSANDYFGILIYFSPSKGYNQFLGPFMLFSESKALINFNIDTLNSSVVVRVNDSEVFSLYDMSFNSRVINHVEFGVNLINAGVTSPSGWIIIRKLKLEVQKIDEIFVSDATGIDSYGLGFDSGNPLKTISFAKSFLTPGTKMKIQDGVYREEVTFTVSGTRSFPITISGEENTFLSGSMNLGSLSSSMVIKEVVSGISKYNLSDFSSLTDTPTFVLILGGIGNHSIIDRFNISQWPNFEPPRNLWDPYEYWAVADGGLTIDKSSLNFDRSFKYLVFEDYWFSEGNNHTLLEDLDTPKRNLSTGNKTFCNFEDLTGSEIFIGDTISRHYIWSRKIVEHDINLCRIKVDENCDFDGSNKEGIGFSSSFLLFNQLQFLDCEKEYFFNSSTKILYIWKGLIPRENIEISLDKNTAFDISGVSNIIIENINFRNYKFGIKEGGGFHRNKNSINVKIRNCHFDHIENGISIIHGTDFNSVAKTFEINNNKFTYISSKAIITMFLYSTWSHIGISDFSIFNNKFYNIGISGFRSGGGGHGTQFNEADHFKVYNNTMRYISHNGFMFYGSPKIGSEIKTCCNLFYKNIIDMTCVGQSDCGGLKIFGGESSNFEFKNFLIMENIIMNIIGYSFTSLIQERWMAENKIYGNILSGLGSKGLMFDKAGGGIISYRNFIFNIGEIGILYWKNWSGNELIGTNSLLISNNIIKKCKQGVYGGSYKTGTLKNEAILRIENNLFFDLYQGSIKITEDSSTSVGNPKNGEIIFRNNLHYHISNITNLPQLLGTTIVTKFDGYYNYIKDLKNYCSLKSQSCFSFYHDPELFNNNNNFGKKEDKIKIFKLLSFEDILSNYSNSSIIFEKGIKKKEIPKDLKNILIYFGICDNNENNKTNFDIGMFEGNDYSFFCTYNITQEKEKEKKKEIIFFNYCSKKNGFIQIFLMIFFLFFFVFF